MDLSLYIHGKVIQQPLAIGCKMEIVYFGAIDQIAHKQAWLMVPMSQLGAPVSPTRGVGLYI